MGPETFLPGPLATGTDQEREAHLSLGPKGGMYLFVLWSLGYTLGDAGSGPPF